MKKTKIAQKICPVKPAQEHLKCNSQERQNKLEQTQQSPVSESSFREQDFIAKFSCKFV